jgi:RNA polymerase sigma-70 factor (ECF subfamily)
MGVPAVNALLWDPAVTDAVAVRTEPVEFVPFYRATRDRTARALAMTLNDASLAAEAVDEAMARAYQRWDKVSGYEQPAAWVYRVALNCATSTLTRRKRAPRPPVERDSADVGPISEPDVMAALHELALHQRSVVVCRFYLGLSEAETAAALGIRPGTVKSRMHRALAHLQQRLSHLHPEEHA